jgi:hypothetical protein
VKVRLARAETETPGRGELAPAQDFASEAEKAHDVGKDIECALLELSRTLS